MVCCSIPSIITLYIGNFWHRKAILAIFGKKFRSSKSTQLTIPKADNFHVNIFLKKLCIREQIECVDAYELFTKQGNVLKSLFDNTDSSGVHISVEGCTKIRDEIVTFFDSDKVISVELKTPRKRTNSALSSTPNSVERQNKQTRIVSPPV